jgi:hypothetical protein
MPQLLSYWKKYFPFSPPIQGELSISTGKLHIDVLKVDKLMDQYNPEYDHNECTFNGDNNISMQEAMKRIYGEEAVEYFNSLL